MSLPYAGNDPHTAPATLRTSLGGSTPNDHTKAPGTDQAGDAVIGMVVLTGGTDAAVSATVTQVPYSFGYANSPGYASIQVTSIDDGVATTNTQSLSLTNDTHLPLVLYGSGLRRAVVASRAPSTQKSFEEIEP